MFSSNTSQVSNDATYIEDVFSTWLYTGNGSTQTITNGIDLSGNGGMVMLRGRATGTAGFTFDTAQGVNKYVLTNSTNGQASNTSLTTFNSNGFSLSSAGAISVNDNGNTYASWTFRKQPKFLDVVTVNHTNGTADNINLSGLGTVGWVIAKITTTTGDWTVWHRSLTAGNNMQLNTTAAQSTTNAWLSVSGTTATLAAAAPTGTYVVYAFAHNAGGFGLTGTDNVISCGSYTGNGGPNVNVNLGYEPQLVLIKMATGGQPWVMADTMRGMPVGSSAIYLSPNSSAAETDTGYTYIEPTATGFNIRGGDVLLNNSGSTYIYIAIRRGPMKVPTDGTKVFSPNYFNNTAGTNITTGFPVDLCIQTGKDYSTNRSSVDRLRGTSTVTTGSGTATVPLLSTNTTSAETTNTGSAAQYWTNTGYQIPSAFANVNNIFWSFGRAPGFFDEVCWTATGSTVTQNHNLGVSPELVISKYRSGSSQWYVNYNFASTTCGEAYLSLANAGGNYAYSAGTGVAAQPTSTQVQFLSATAGITEVAYLFASCPGVSKVGSYTGNGSTQTINCGFTGGARFVLIKRTDSTGDWYVWDTARGIVSGNDPYLLLNSTAAEVTSTDYIDPVSSGFEISSTAPAAINASGGTFIYLAIA